MESILSSSRVGKAGTLHGTKWWRAFHSQSVRSEQSPLTEQKAGWRVGRSNWKSLVFVVV